MLPFQGVEKETWEATQGAALGCVRLVLRAGKIDEGWEKSS